MPERSWCTKIKHFLSLITVEPTISLYMMAYMLTSVIESSFFVYKACITNHNLDEKICNNLTASENQDYNIEVQVSTKIVNYN